MMLELVVLCGTFSQDKACAVQLVEAGFPELLITCLKGSSVLKTSIVSHYLQMLGPYVAPYSSQCANTSMVPSYLLRLGLPAPL